MMETVCKDIRLCAGLFFDLRRARAEGHNVHIKKMVSIPVVQFGYWGFTMESCLWCEKEHQPIRDVFNRFDKETQHVLTFSPCDGEWAARIRFWQQRLRPVLEPRLYYRAMLELIQWSIRCVKRRNGIAR